MLLIEEEVVDLADEGRGEAARCCGKEGMVEERGG